MWGVLVFFHAHIINASEDHSNLFQAQSSFFSTPTLEILFALVHQMILLIRAHREYYAGTPFMPWHYGTPWMEHFFGLARSFDADMTYSRLLEMYKHIELCQHILSQGAFTSQHEKDSNNGYSFDPYVTNLTDNELLRLKSVPDESQNQPSI